MGDRISDMGILDDVLVLEQIQDTADAVCGIPSSSTIYQSVTMITCHSSQISRQPCLWRRLPDQFSLCKQRLMSTSSNHKKLPKTVRPYSASLPLPGYEWCSRCGIRTHNFQKRIGEHHSCLDLPRPIWFLQSGMCENARQYYRNQINIFLVLSVTLFCVIPAGDILVGRTTCIVPNKNTCAESVSADRQQ